MNWQTLKENIYFEDGSLRDIIAHSLTIEDWKRWIDFLNNSYNIEFEDHENGSISHQVKFNIIEDYWNQQDRSCIRLSIKLADHICINCFFADIKEFENDIDPREFKSINDHNLLLDYLTSISQLFGKPVFLTEENGPQNIFLKVDSAQ